MKRENTGSSGSRLSLTPRGGQQKTTHTTTSGSKEEGRPAGRRGAYIDQRGSPWGPLQRKSSRSAFAMWLKKLKDVKACSEKSWITWYRRLPITVKRKIRKRLREISPAEYSRWKGRLFSYSQREKMAKKFFKKQEIKKIVEEKLVMVAEEIKGEPGASIIRFVDPGGVRGVAAVCVAAGYTRDEVAKMLKMDRADLNTLVSAEDVKDAMRKMPNAVAQVADQVVMRDLLVGVVSDATSRADMIACRRRKIALEASAEGRAWAREAEDVQKDREKQLEDRFGVNRVKGEVINVTPEKGKEKEE